MCKRKNTCGMMDQDKSKQQLIAENDELRRRVAALEAVDLERRRRVEALQEKPAATLPALLETAPLGIYECDIQGIILNVNPSAERITGYCRDELIGTHLWDHFKLGPQKEALAAHLSHLATAQPLPSTYFLEGDNQRRSPYRNPGGVVLSTQQGRTGHRVSRRYCGCHGPHRSRVGPAET